MPRNIRVIHHSDFVRARPDGKADLAEGERLMAAIAEASASLADFQILIDTRGLTGVPTDQELFHLATRLVDYGGTFRRRTAVLCPADRLDRANFFAFLAAGRGYANFRAFVTYEEAMDWLLADEPG